MKQFIYSRQQNYSSTWDNSGQKTLMQFYKMNICQAMIFRLYAVYNTHKMAESSIQTREKFQVLSQVLFMFE